MRKSGPKGQRDRRSAQTGQFSSIHFAVETKLTVASVIALQKLDHRVAALTSERATLKDYMRQRMEGEDWHGVMDAAADIREIDVELRCLKNTERL